jgi:2-keto-3-deoxy-L-rhamnonate aldolase RhmA
MIMDENDAAKAVAACRYPMDGGNRGCGFRRAWRYGLRDTEEMLAEAAHEPIVILQIEHIDAARRLDRILEVPGIDSILVGAYDFSASMGKPGRFDDPDVCAAIDEVCAKVAGKGILLGTYCESDFDVWLRRGVRYMGIKNDTGAMIDGWRGALLKARAK